MTKKLVYVFINFIMVLMLATNVCAQIPLPKVRVPRLLELELPDFVHSGEQLKIDISYEFEEVYSFWIQVIRGEENKISGNMGSIGIDPDDYFIKIDGIPGESVDVFFDETEIRIRMRSSRELIRLETGKEIMSLWIQVVRSGDKRIGIVGPLGQTTPHGDIASVTKIGREDAVIEPGDNFVMIQGTMGESFSLDFEETVTSLLIRPNDPWNLDIPALPGSSIGYEVKDIQ